MAEEYRPDPQLRAALRDAVGGVPLDEVDWSGMHRRIIYTVDRLPPTLAVGWARAWWRLPAGWAAVTRPNQASAA